MESIPEEYLSRKTEPPYLKTYETDQPCRDGQDVTDGYSNPDMDRHLYGSDHSVEGGDVFYPGDFC